MAVAGFHDSEPAAWQVRGRGGQVVAAELMSGGSREVVMFITRVADDRGEWTLARRFRHFESLHRSLRWPPAPCRRGRPSCTLNPKPCTAP